jgi:hypothetical protein
MSWRTLERGGLAKRAIGMSSKPATAISSGTLTPAFRNAWRTPTAIESFAAKIAVGRGERPRIASPAASPDSSPKSPSISAVASGGSPAALRASRQPRRRSPESKFEAGPVTSARRRCPRARRWATIARAPPLPSTLREGWVVLAGGEFRKTTGSSGGRAPSRARGGA